MNNLIKNLRQAEDALAVYQANAKLSGRSVKEEEQSLIDSVNHAELQIQKFNEDKDAFWEKYRTDLSRLKCKQKIEEHDFIITRLTEAKEKGYDN